MNKLVPLLAVPLLFGCVVEEGTGSESDVFVTEEAPSEPDIVQAAEFFATGGVNNSSYSSQHFSVAHFEVVDADGLPAAGVKVHGRFTGDINYKFTGVTNEDGMISAKSFGYDTHLAVGVTLDRVSYFGLDGQEVIGNLFADDVPPRFCQHDIPTPSE